MSGTQQEGTAWRDGVDARCYEQGARDGQGCARLCATQYRGSTEGDQSPRVGTAYDEFKPSETPPQPAMSGSSEVVGLSRTGMNSTSTIESLLPFCV